jgi:hypothetical protein
MTLVLMTVALLAGAPSQPTLRAFHRGMLAPQLITSVPSRDQLVGTSN